MLKSISIEGVRGFGNCRKLNFAIPDGENKGSGLTHLVGSNNSGKTTIIECIKYYRFDANNISFSEGKRNQKTGNKIRITYTDVNGESYSIKTPEHGGSQVESDMRPNENNLEMPFVLSSRRHVYYEMSSHYGGYDRWSYLQNEYMNTRNRKPTIDNFHQRIFKWESNWEEFNEILYKIIDRKMKWNIEQNDNQNYYLKFQIGEQVSHTSEGLGDGMWSIFTIVDALYDSKPGSIIAIDEPELSLHPQFQKKIMDLLLDYSKDRQIIISTHSPYFISWDSLINGGELARVYIDEDLNVRINNLKDANKKFIKSIFNDKNNPHVLGLEARELFFLDDNLIVVEGQEDVIGFKRIQEQLSLSLGANFFGWGAGGASKINRILSMLKELGYKKVAAIFDGDQEEEYNKCVMEHGDVYNIKILWKDDIRDKNATNKKEKEGITNSKFRLKDEDKVKTLDLFQELNRYFEQ